jgi:hypothetical protein
MNKRLAKWIVVHAGNLAVKLAPQAGFDLVFRLRSHKRNQPPAPAPPTTKPELFEATCLDCEWDSFEFYGHEGAKVLDFHCLVCQGRRWHVEPITSHQGSRRV